MITYYYKSLRSKEVKELTEYQRGAWVYAEAPSKSEVEYLVKTFKLDQSLLNDALDEDEMPRLEKSDDHTYLYMRMAFSKQHNELDTVPLLFVFTSDAVITISLKRLVCLDAFLDSKIEFATTQRTKLILQVIHEIVETYDVYITGISKQIKTIRSRLRGHEINNQDFVDFVTIEDELNEFLSALLPTNATLRRLLLGRVLPLFDDDQDLIEDLLLSNEQSIEACRASIKTIVNIREAYSSINSNNINRTMKILTLATVMISLPNIIFGMYGMNVLLPFQQNHWAFLIVVGFVLFVLTIVISLLRKLRIM